MLVVVAVAVLVISAPLRRGRRDEREAAGEAERADLEAARDAKYAEIRDAEIDYRTGKLSEPDWRSLDRAAPRGRRVAAPARRCRRTSQPRGLKGVAIAMRKLPALLAVAAMAFVPAGALAAKPKPKAKKPTPRAKVYKATLKAVGADALYTTKRSAGRSSSTARRTTR